MKGLTAVALFTLFSSTAAFAAGPSCDAQAAEKKLAGAAKTSFVKKCEKDSAEAATKTCTDQAAEKKLNGAAKNSFVQKCVKDAAAAPAAAARRRSTGGTPRSTGGTQGSRSAEEKPRVAGRLTGAWQSAGVLRERRLPRSSSRPSPAFLPAHSIDGAMIGCPTPWPVNNPRSQKKQGRSRLPGAALSASAGWTGGHPTVSRYWNGSAVARVAHGCSSGLASFTGSALHRSPWTHATGRTPLASVYDTRNGYRNDFARYPSHVCSKME